MRFAAPQRDNPVQDYVLRRWSRGTAGVAFLLYALLLLAPAGFLVWFGDRSFVVPYAVGRWVYAEFLLCWMAADGFFATWAAMERARLPEDLRTTPLPEEEVLAGVASPVVIVCSVPLVLLCGVEALLVPAWLGFNSEEALDFRCFALFSCLSVGSSLLLTTSLTAHAVATRRPPLGPIQGAWARTLLQAGGHLSLVLVGSLVLGFLAILSSIGDWGLFGWLLPMGVIAGVFGGIWRLILAGWLWPRAVRLLAQPQ